MKRVTIAISVILLIAAMFAAFAQQPEANISEYVVQPGDNLWTLSEVYKEDPQLWEQVVEQNDFLKEPGRIYRGDNGWVYVLIKPGERLRGLTELGINPQPAQSGGIKTLQPIQLNVAATPATEGFNWARFILLLLLACIAVAAILAAAYMYRRRRISNPATAGPPMVEGGVTNETVADVFRTRAAASYTEATGRTWHPRQFRIVDLVRGRGYGAMNVRYRDGRIMPRHLNGDTLYRATMIMPDGSREERYILQACGNDVDPNYSGIDRYIPGAQFRFVPDSQGTVEVPPTPTPTPVREIRTMPEFRPSITNHGDSTVISVMGMEIVVGSADLTAEFSSNSVVLRHPEYGEMTIRRQQPAVAAQTTDQQAAAS